MNTRDDLVELARMCLRQASASQTKEAADELRRMAREYEDKAARLDSGRVDSTNN